MIYYKKESNKCFYRILTNYKTIQKDSVKETKVYRDDLYEKIIDEILKLPDIKKQEWNESINKMYNTYTFEWFYKGKKFKTCELTDEYRKKFDPHKTLVFHNGYVWKAWFGSHYPRIVLFRTENGRGKWTHVRNLRGIMQC